MITFDCHLDWEGRPIMELQRFLEKRVKILGESSRDACIATAIDVLKSLRALCRTAKTKPIAGIQFLIVDTGYVGGWKSKGDAGKMSRFFRGTRKGLKLDSSKYLERCVRTARYRGSVVPDIHPIWITGPGAFDKGQTVHIYRVTPRHAGVMKWDKNRHKGCWYIAAYSQDKAKKYAAKQLMQKYLKYTSGIAKYALTKAMTKLSTKNDADASKLPLMSKKLAEKNISVRSFGGDNEWTVAVDDSLAYAVEAFARPDALSFAMMKAANSISGYLRRRAIDVFDPEIATPFPEIAKGGSMR